MKKPLLLLALILPLLVISACNIVPDLSSPENVKNYDEKAERKQMLEIKAFAEEWEAMKPALVSLISLESDLQFILNNIEQGDDALTSATQLQSAVESEEEIAAYETMIFEDAEDLTSEFSDSSEELEKLSKLSLFADAELLEELIDSANEISTDLPISSPDELEPLTDADLFSTTVVTTSDPLEGEVELIAAAPVAEYLREAGDTSPRPIPDVPIFGFSENEQVGGFEHEQRPLMESKFSNTEKFDTAYETRINDMDAKFSLIGGSQSVDPSNIVGTIERPKVQSEVAKNLKTNSKCMVSNVQVGVGYAMHLASYSSLDNARKGWERMSNNFASELCGLVALTEQVTVNNKQFYSLRAGGFDTKEMADRACSKLTNKNEYCRSTRFVGDSFL